MPHPAPNEDRSFSPTTRWSRIIRATGTDEEKAREALEQLCVIYRSTVLNYIRRRGYSPEDAEDRTQDFFERLSKPDFLRSADPAKGRFRSLVFASLKHLLSDARDWDDAGKRGGGVKFVPWENSLEDQMSAAEIARCTESQADHLFDRDWANAVVRRALSRWEDHLTIKGKKRHIAIFRPFLTGGKSDYAGAAAELDAPVATLRAMVCRYRELYRELLKDEVAQTLADPHDLEDEVRHLRAILTALPAVAHGHPE